MAKWCSQEPLETAKEGEDVSKLPNRVADVLTGRAIFITGGTGFMGKVLLEKILRTCSSVDTIYLLIRNKKGKEPRQRIEEIFASPVSDQILCTKVYLKDYVHLSLFRMFISQTAERKYRILEITYILKLAEYIMSNLSNKTV
jgi:FlaA1/EpsC-like NDP-sugar epimerase